LAALVADEMLLVADPAILAVLLAEAVFRGVLALLEDLDQLGLDPIDVIWVDASAPEGWILQIFGGTIAKQPLDVLADEGRRVIVPGLERVDHRGRRLEQKRETPPRLVPGGFGGFARGDVAPGADDLLRLALLVVDEMLVVVHPAIGAVLAAEAIFDGLPPGREQVPHLLLHSCEVIGVDASAPEVRVVQIFARVVAEQALDIGADEGRREIAARREAVNHDRRGIEQPRKLLFGSGLRL